MTDGWIEYPAAITATFDDLCDHAQVIAPERQPPSGGYAPTRGRKRKKLKTVKRLGLPDDRVIGISFVERNNGTGRQQRRRSVSGLGASPTPTPKPVGSDQW